MYRDNPGVIGLVRSKPGPAFVIAVLGSVACGIGLTFWPVVASAVLLTAIAGTLFIGAKRSLLKTFLLFLLFQDLLQVLAGGESPLALIVKRADEPMVLIFGGLCILFSSSVHRSLRSRGLLTAIGVCYVGLILSSIPPRSGAVPALLDFALFSKPFCIFAIGLSIVPDNDEIERSLKPLLVLLLIVIIFGIVFLLAPRLQDAYIGAVRAPDERLGLLSAQGYFIGPGTYSWVAAATFAIAYAAYLAYSRVFYMVASFIAACFVVLSWRRKSILVVLTILLISLLVRTSRKSRARAVAVVALSIAVVATVLAPYAIGLWQSTVREYGSGNPNASARSALYYTSFLIARDHFPLGTGLATFGSHASKLYYSDVYIEYGIAQVYGLSPSEANFITDTFWPMVLGEGGVVSIVALASFFWILVVVSWRAVRRTDQDPTGTLVSLAALFLLTGSLIESTASHIYGSSLQAALVLIPVGILWEREQRRAAVSIQS